MKSFPTFLFLAFFSLTTASLFAQSDSDVLFTVGDNEVTVGEFNYIYAKSNGEAADFSKASVQEYLDLYQRFKLKVERAREMGLDTISALQKELAGYRRQLANNYLIDRQVTDKLVKELHERQQEDIEFSHIFFKFKGNPTPADTLALYNQVAITKEGINQNNFAEKASLLSDDNYSKNRGGKVGFIHAPFPRGMGELETALYEAPAGTIVGPIQSKSGYHLAIKHDSRPAKGEMEVAHILARKSKDDPSNTAARKKIMEAQAMLARGDDFGKVAKEVSEDGETKDNSGYLGFFGINFYEPAFEKAAFALTLDGEVSGIVETEAGFHLIRRISTRKNVPLEDVRPALEAKVKADDRFAKGKKHLLAKVKVQSQIQENSAALEAFIAGMDPVQFASARWKPTQVVNNDVLFSMENGQTGSVADFQQYLLKNSRKRMSLARNATGKMAGVARKLYEDWIDAELLVYADSRLEKDYPEFAALMREYREGILLFEATKMEVWDKAGEDSTGLVAFYEANKKNYQWAERARVSKYTVNTKMDVDVNMVMTHATKHPPAAVTGKYGADKVEVATDNYELDRLGTMEMLKPEVGSVSMVKNDLRSGTATFFKTEELLPAGQKALDEARGYVIADYQDELERQWVEKLRKIYPVKVNKRVLNKIIK